MSSRFSESRDLKYVGSAMCPECPGKIGEASPAGYTHGKMTQMSSKALNKGTGGITTSPTMLGCVLMWSQMNYLIFLLIVRYLESS